MAMTRWRKRIGPDALEEVLKATVVVALETETVKPSSLERETADTTVQPKAIAHPTAERRATAAFSRLYLRALLTLVGRAKKAGIELCQSHTRLAKTAAMKAGRCAHARQFKRMRRELKRLKTYLGRLRGLTRPHRGHGPAGSATSAARSTAIWIWQRALPNCSA
jgi:IS5 family transposase